jgi:hypothetical protein
MSAASLMLDVADDSFGGKGEGDDYHVDEND